MRKTTKPSSGLSSTQSTKLLPLRTPKSQIPPTGAFHSREPSKISSLAKTVKNSPIGPSTSKYKENSENEPKLKKASSFKSIQSVNTLPQAPETVLRSNKLNLTPWEQTEILEYEKIFFFSKKQFKIRKTSCFNNGFDNDQNEYKANIGDHIAYRYEVISLLGKGSFGQVFKVFDHREKELQALKIIKNRPKFHKQGAIEVQVLQSFRQIPENTLIQIKESFNFREHLCITFELFSINLFEYLKLSNFKGLSLGFIQRIAEQLLTGLKLCKTLGIIHCDLKPENILLKHPRQTSVKIIDFGSSCFEGQQVFTYIQSRFYRAPEVVLRFAYSSSIDMWSFGCILVELFTGFPLFAGEDERDQLFSMIEVLGELPESVLEKVELDKVSWDLKGSKRVPGSKKIKDVLRGCDEEFIDLVTRCLQWEVAARISPDEALKHPWIHKNISVPI